MRRARGYHNWQTPIDLNDQVAIVAGGSGGIGLAIARELDRCGCRTVVTGRDASRVSEAVAALDRGVGFAGCDIRQAERVAELFDFALERFGRLDIVVGSAGIGRAAQPERPIPDAVHSLPIAEWDEVIDTNLRGMFLLCRAAAKQMQAKRSGQIVNISSARAALRGQPCAAAYSASKMAVHAMFQSLAEEMKPFGVRVMSLLPDAVDTSLIAATRLARRGAMAPATLGEFVVDLLTMPMDSCFESPLLAPLGARPARPATAREKA
jgi:3-oxoacyl-[acyl-carrier protein] reductase